MTWLRPSDRGSVAYEFYAPFAHVPGKYEWCTIRSATHGAFDCFILLGESAGSAATVYVANREGERFMSDRFPECETYRVPTRALSIGESRGGRTVSGALDSGTGPVRSARMRIAASASARPRAVPYGGNGEPVWGSQRYTCWGVDLALFARATGTVRFADGRTDRLSGAGGVVTLGSFGRISRIGRRRTPTVRNHSSGKTE